MVSRGSLSYRSSDSHKPRWLHYDLGHQSRLMAQCLLSLEYCSGSLRSRSHHVNWTELEPWTCANWWERSHRTNSLRTMRPRSICSQSVRSRSMWRDAELCAWRLGVTGSTSSVQCERGFVLVTDSHAKLMDVLKSVNQNSECRFSRQRFPDFFYIFLRKLSVIILTELRTNRRRQADSQKTNWLHCYFYDAMVTYLLAYLLKLTV